MSFGQELKDFTSAFSTGYNAASDARDKKEERKRHAINDPIDNEYKKESTKSMSLRNKWYDSIAEDQHNAAEDTHKWYGPRSRAAIDASDASIYGTIFPKSRSGKPGETLDADTPVGAPDASGAPVGDHAPGATEEAVPTGPSDDSAPDDTSDESSDAGGDASVQNASYRPASSAGDVYNRFMGTVYHEGVTNPNGLAAIAATANRESKFAPSNAYGSWSDPSENGAPGRAGGIMSWRGGRYSGLQAFASKVGDNPGRPSPETQAKYLFHEDPTLKKRLNAAQNPREAMQIMNNAWAFAGYNRPGGETAARYQTADKYAGIYSQSLSKGGLVVHAAVGGVIPALPGVDDEEDQNPPQQMAQAAPPQQVQQALPVDNAPVPTQRPVDQTATDTSEGNAKAPDVGYDPSVAGDPKVMGFTKAHEAVLDGIRYSLQEMGLAKGAAVTDPDRAAKMADYLKGVGAAPKAVIDQAYDAVDPKKELPESERTMAALGMVYDHYIKRGEPAKAKAAAASIVQYQRKLFQQYSSIAKAAVADGDIDAATKAAVKAYSSVPDGQDMTVKKQSDGRYMITIKDEATGKTVSKPVLTPQEIGGWAMKVSPGSFDQFLMDAAGQRKQGGGAPSDGFQSLASAIDDGKMPSNKDMATLPLSEQKELRQRVAAWTKENGGGGAKDPTYTEGNSVRSKMPEKYQEMASQTDADGNLVHKGMADLPANDVTAITDAASDIMGSPRNRSADYNVSEDDAMSAAFVVSQSPPNSDDYKVSDKDNGKLVELSDGTQVWMPKPRFNRLSNIFKRQLAATNKSKQDSVNAGEDAASSKQKAIKRDEGLYGPDTFGDPNTPSPLIGNSAPQSAIDSLQKLMGQ